MPNDKARMRSLQASVAELLVERDRMRRKVENLERDMDRVAQMLPQYNQTIAALRDEVYHLQSLAPTQEPEPEVVYIVPNAPMVRVPQMVKPEPTKPKPFIRG